MNATRRRAVSRVSRLARSAAAPARQGHQRQSGAPVPAIAQSAERRPNRIGLAEVPGAEPGRGAGVPSLPAAIAKKLQDGKLEQACPDCGRWEAAGSYCSGCDRRMGPDDWYRNGDETRRAVAQNRAGEIAATRVKRPRGRPRAALHVPTTAPRASTNPDAGFWPA